VGGKPPWKQQMQRLHKFLIWSNYFTECFFATMNNATSNNYLSSPSFANQSILGMNRKGIQHFQEGRFSEATECFLSAIQTMKRTCSLGEEAQEGLSANDEHRRLDVRSSCCCQESTCEKHTAAMTRFGAVLPPMDFCDVSFALHQQQHNEASIQLRDAYSRYTLISFVLIFNLASTIHHQALVVDDDKQLQQQQQQQQHLQQTADSSNSSSNSDNSCTKPTVPRDVLVKRALRLYQRAFEGLSSIHDDTMSSSGLDNTIRSRRIVLRQQLLLSTGHNMGLLLLSTEENRTLLNEDNDPEMTVPDSSCSNICNKDTTQQFPSSHRCFQVVFATIHALSDYYGIQHSDFPSDFDLQLVIDTALEGLQSCHPLRGTATTTTGHNAVPYDMAPSA
jgi:hypothetical protein